MTSHTTAAYFALVEGSPQAAENPPRDAMAPDLRARVGPLRMSSQGISGSETNKAHTPSGSPCSWGNDRIWRQRREHRVQTCQVLLDWDVAAPA